MTKGGHVAVRDAVRREGHRLTAPEVSGALLLILPGTDPYRCPVGLPVVSRTVYWTVLDMLRGDGILAVVGHLTYPAFRNCRQ